MVKKLICQENLLVPEKVRVGLTQGEVHKDSVEHFDDFRRRKSGQNDDFRGRFYAVAEFASLGAENGYCLTIFGAENRAKMTILGTNR